MQNKNIIKQKLVKMILLKNKRLRYRCPVTFDCEEHKCDSEMRSTRGLMSTLNTMFKRYIYIYKKHTFNTNQSSKIFFLFNGYVYIYIYIYIYVCVCVCVCMFMKLNLILDFWG